MHCSSLDVQGNMPLAVSSLSCTHYLFFIALCCRTWDNKCPKRANLYATFNLCTFIGTYSLQRLRQTFYTESVNILLLTSGYGRHHSFTERHQLLRLSKPLCLPTPGFRALLPTSTNLAGGHNYSQYALLTLACPT